MTALVSVYNFHLGWDGYLSIAVYVRSPKPWVFRDGPDSASHLTVTALGLQMCTPFQLYRGPRYLYSSAHACIVNVLPTDTTLWPHIHELWWYHSMLWVYKPQFTLLSYYIDFLVLCVIFVCLCPVCMFACTYKHVCVWFTIGRKEDWT